MALPATIAPATPLGSDLKSDGDNQLRALKQFIVDVLGVPSNTPINNPAFSITTGGLVTVPQAMALSSTLTVAGAATLASLGVTGAATVGTTLGVTGAATLSSTLGVTGAATLSSTLDVTGAATVGTTLGVTDIAYINETSNAKMTKGITINGAGDNNENLAIKSSLHAHGVTSFSESDTYFNIRYSPVYTAGQLWGYGEADMGLEVRGTGETGTTTKSATAKAPLYLSGSKRNSTFIASMGANENVMAVASDAATKLIVDAEGDLHVDGSSTLATFDDYDDLKLLTAARASLMPDCDFKERFYDWVREYAPVLAQGKIITYNDDGHHFVSYKGMQGLMIDTIRQLGERIICLEQHQQIASSGSTIKKLWKRALPRLKSTFASARPKSIS